LALGPSATDSDRYAAKILATVLGDDSGSRLYWALVDSGLAEQASLSHHDYQGAGLFMTYMSCAAESAQDNIAQIAAIYRQAEREGITAAELAQAKSKINSRVVLGSERPRGRLFTVGGNWIQRREYRTVKSDLEAIDAVSQDELQAVLARYPLSLNTTLAIGPAEKLALIAFHELMHNKLQRGNDMHKNGGGGLAVSPAQGWEQLTARNKQLMAAALRTPVRQYTGRL